MIPWFSSLSRYHRLVVALTAAGVVLALAMLTVRLVTGGTPWYLLAPTGGFLSYGLFHFPYPRQGHH